MNLKQLEVSEPGKFGNRSMAILVVDSNEPGRHHKSRQLAELGYRVHAAASGASAIAAIEANRIELAIIDAHLPDMSGLQLCKVIKDQNAGLLVLQTSAPSLGPGEVAVPEEGADAYLPNPVAPREFVTIVRALLRLRDAEAHRELLVRELSHRVRNSLAIVQSLIGFTRRSVASLDEFEALLISRVHAIARAHDILMQTAGEGAMLGSIIEAVIAPFGRNRFVLRGPRIWLAPNPAVRFGLAIHELATNASKHGALTADAGQIEVRWTTDTTTPPGLLNLSWIEIGGPEVRVPAEAGFGATLVGSLLAPDTENATRFDYLPSGLKFWAGLALSDRIRLR
jgi:two-component sensor histidine kinase